MLAQPKDSSSKVYKILESLVNDGPMPIHALLAKTNANTEDFYAARKHGIRIFPERGHRRAARHYKVRDFVGDELADYENRPAFLDGDELYLFQQIKGYLPSSEELKKNMSLRVALQHWMPYTFSPRLAFLYYYHCGKKFTGRTYPRSILREMSIESLLQDPKVIDRTAWLLLKYGKIEADVFITAPEDGVKFTKTVARRLRNVDVVVCTKTQTSDGKRKITLNEKVGIEKLNSKEVYRMDDRIDTLRTMKQMREIIEKAGGKPVGMGVQIVNQNFESLEDLDFVCSISGSSSL